MYISCYDEYEDDFEHAGEFKVFVKEENNNLYRAINGQFCLTIKVSFEDNHCYDIKARMIVKIPTPNKKNKLQLFRLYDQNEDTTGISFTGYPIAWDLATGLLPHVNIVAKNRLQASEYILEKAKETKPHRFTVVDLNPKQEAKNLQIVRYNPLVALMGKKDNTVLNRYEGVEFDFNNFEIILTDQLGDKTDFEIRDGKNVISYTRDIDYKPLATRIMPQGADELLLPELFVDSPNIDMYQEVFYKHVVFDEIGIGEEEGITKEDAIALLREAAMKLFTESKIDMPVLSWTIGFDDGQANEDIPEKLRELMKLDLGDEVLVKKTGMYGRLESRIKEYNWNIVSKKYVDMTIGSIANTLTSDIEKTNSEIKVKVDNFTSVIKHISEDMYSQIQQAYDEISLKVAKDELSAEIQTRSDAVNVAINNGQGVNGINVTHEGLSVFRNKIRTMLLNDGLMNIYNSITGQFMGYFGTVGSDLRAQLYGANTFSVYAGDSNLKIMEVKYDRNASYGNAMVDICGGVVFTQRPGQDVGFNGILLGNDDRSDAYGYHNMSVRCHNSLGFADNYGYTNMFMDIRRGRMIMKGSLYQNTETPPNSYILSMDERHPFFCGRKSIDVVESILNLKTTIKVDNDDDQTMMILPNDDDLIMTEFDGTQHVDHMSITAGLVEVVKSLNKKIVELENQLKNRGES